MTAYYAFKAGADAVYTGMKKFSARQNSQNLSRLEYLKLRHLADRLGKKVYVAVNTVVTDGELGEVFELLSFLERAGVDAVIVQDAGVARMIQTCFPGIVTHASTQMTIHNDWGIERAASLGIRRVVLPREMPLKEITRIKNRHPAMEFEIFVHGALCYSYSGLCLASGMTLGRSGNRGQCAQMCRDEYSRDGVPGFHLSCRDQVTARDFERVLSAGIHSFKIEGRQKSPEYAFHTVALYREVIDRGGCLDLARYEALARRSRAAFSREETSGYLLGGARDQLITRSYARHVGEYVGVVARSDEGTFTIDPAVDIVPGDVLSIRLNAAERLPYKFTVKRMIQGGVDARVATAGIPVTIAAAKVPEPGQEARRIFAQMDALPGVEHETFPSRKINVPARLSVTEGATPFWRFEFNIHGRERSFDYPAFFRSESGQGQLESFMGAVAHCVDSPFEVAFEPPTIDMIAKYDRLPVPGDLVKRLRQALFEYLDRLDSEWNARRFAEYRASLESQESTSSVMDRETLEFVSRRSRVNPNGGAIPFYDGGAIRDTTFASVGTSRFVPLFPVAYDVDAYARLIEYIDSRADLTFYLGINNVHHIELARMCRDRSHVRFFVDFFFYLANGAALAYARAEVSRLAFAYYWIEGGERSWRELADRSGFPIVSVGDDFSPPLFFHEGSFAEESLLCRTADPAARFEADLSRADRVYRVISASGWTYVFASSKQSSE